MEGHFSITDWQVVPEPAAVQALLDPHGSLLLRPFLEGERSAGEAAQQLDLRLDTLLYQIKRLCRLGLLRHTRSETRRGRTVKLYRASAQGFVLPFSAMQADTLLDLFMQQDDPERRRLGQGLIDAVVGRGGGWRVRVYWNAHDRTMNWEAAPDHDPDWRQEDLLGPEAPAAWHTNMAVFLDTGQAKALQAELAGLFARYHALSGAAGGAARRYTFQLGLSPRMD